MKDKEGSNGDVRRSGAVETGPLDGTGKEREGTGPEAERDLQAECELLARRNAALAKERDRLARRIRALETSNSWRAGRALTWGPRKAAALLRKLRGDRENRMEIFPSEVSGDRIVYRYAVSGEWTRYFRLDKTFAATYPFGLEGIPESIRIVPFLSQVLPVAWVCDAEIRMPVLDRAFHDCLGAVEDGYRAMYPAIPFKGKLKAKRLERNVPDRKARPGALACFSGGVDALATVLRHLPEKPVLVSVWGADVPWEDEEGWAPIGEAIRGNAEKLSLESLSIRSSFRDMLYKDRLNRRVPESGENWWHGFQHGLGILGHLAPVAWAKGAGTVYIASSFTAADTYTCASDPTIDNHVRFCGAAVVHDAYEWDRQDKVRRIAEHAAATGISFPLHVCWEKKGGKNCCHCEKCWRTMLALWVEGADPKNFGFERFDGFGDLPADMERDAVIFRTTTAANYRPIQKRLKSRMAEKDVPPELLWLWNADFASPDAAPSK